MIRKMLHGILDDSVYSQDGILHRGAWLFAVLVVESGCSEDKVLNDECMVA